MEGFFQSIPDDFQRKLRVFHAAGESSGAFSVKEICERSGISRSTFYRYFSSQEDFCCWFVLFCANSTADRIGTQYDWHEGLLRYFRLLEWEYDALRVCAKWGGDACISYVASCRGDALRKALGLMGPVGDGLDFAVTWYAQAEMRAIMSWLWAREKEAPELISSKIEACVPSALRGALDKGSMTR